MILRYDRLGLELPTGDPDPAGAMAVQELMGGRFGEMSTLMNYTFQSFNFRGRNELRPFYDLIANIAAEEYGHIEVVGAAIGAMLTGADGRDVIEQGNPHHVLKGGKGVLPVDSTALPWTGDYVFSSGDLVEDLTHNYFLETGARNGKLKVYELVEHPDGARADRLPAGARRRAPGRVCARARAAHRHRPDEGLPGAADPDREDSRVSSPHLEQGPAPDALPVLAGGLQGGHRRLQGQAPRDRRGAPGRGQRAGRVPVARSARPAGRVRP